MEPIVINLPLPDLLKERNYVVKYFYMTMYSEYIEVRGNYKCETDNSEDDDNPKWEDRIHYSCFSIEKKAIKYISYYYHQKADVFYVSIDAMGIADAERFYFKSKKECEKVYNQIHNWLYDKLSNQLKFNKMGNETTQQTFGQKQVGLNFNPSGDDAVGKVKQIFADAIDQMNELRSTTESADVKRFASVAITEAQTAQMWAVKAITWKD